MERAPVSKDRRFLRAVIIEWLGPRFDHDDVMGSNPDYVSREEVDDLVERIMVLLDLT